MTQNNNFLTGINYEVFATAEQLGNTCAERILGRIAGNPGQFLLGCPGGRSLMSTYRALGRIGARFQSDLSGLVVVMMDDYVVADGAGFKHCPADAHYSCRRFAYEDIFQVLNRDLPAPRRMRKENVWFPDPSDPREYDARIAEAGGIGIFLLASGASDGHVAFNPPGSAADSMTRIIALPDSTRRDNLATFPEFTSLSEVPGYGVSVGLGTISSLSREVIMVIHGDGKRYALDRLLSSGGFDPCWPASVVYRCANASILCDCLAAGRAAHSIHLT